MSHRLGSYVPLSPPREFRPGSGVLVGANTWEDTFSAAAPPSGTTKFMILHFSAVTLQAGDRLEVPLGNGDTDVFTQAAGPDFWTRPIKGGTVAIRFVDGGSGAGRAPLAAYGRGEGIVNDGAAGGNANGDLFLLDTPYVDPGYFNPLGVCPAGARNWRNVDCLPAGVMRNVARSTGIIIEVGGDKVSSCSAALIAPDLILTAAHCLEGGSEVPSGSFTFDFQTDCGGDRPAGYNPKFYKLKRLVKSGWAASTTGPGLKPDSGLDYAIIQIETPPGGLGVPPLPIRADVPAIGEEVFLIHHPRGATKKVSERGTDPECVVKSNGIEGAQGRVIRFGGDLDNGSSGSSLFDRFGRIIGVNDWASDRIGDCKNGAQSAAAILQDIAAAPPPPRDVDVVLALDRSGSMNLPGLSGTAKIQEARAAAALFVDLLRTDKTHRAGLVTFSTSAASPVGLAPVSTNKPALTSGINSITPGGMTSIGGGLRAGRQQIVSSPSANTPAILLLTDGLQNTPPFIDEVRAELGDTRVCIIGFGTEGQLDGPLLTRLARDYGGIYTRSQEGLQLKKFFVLCFGNIFHTGIALDPFYVFPAGSLSMPPIPLQVRDEESLTVVVSWQSPWENLFFTLLTPAGNTITATTPGVFSSSGDTWLYFRLQLPLNGERDGTWQIQVGRSQVGGEFPPPPAEERFFVTAVVDGGPYLKPLNREKHYYTGDQFNPQVVLREPSGFLLEAASVTVDIETPLQGTGNILVASGLQAPRLVDGDQLDARSSTLVQLEQQQGSPLIGTTATTFPLFDDGDKDGLGTLEPDGVFGNPLTDLLRFEGTYALHARATYGTNIIGTRETLWAVYVVVGIDPKSTQVQTTTVGPLPNGRELVRITFTPQDRYGNYLGPGRTDLFDVQPQPGSILVGGVRDLGNGSYEQDVSWDPKSARPPRIGLAQPERPVAVVGAPLATFPATGIRDSFNRQNGPLKNNWYGDARLTGYAVVNRQLAVSSGGPIYWKAGAFGPTLEAYATFVHVGTGDGEQGLLLKVQGQGTHPDYQEGAIKVVYVATTERVRVESIEPGQSFWVGRGEFAAPVRDGDQLGARAFADGWVAVFLNGQLIGEVDTGSFFSDKRGRIGLWFEGVSNAILDDFGGGTTKR